MATFKTSEIAVAFAAVFPSKLPFLMNTNKELQKNFVAGNGRLMNISLPDPGIVGTGAVINDNQLNYTAGSVALELVQYNTAFGADQLTRSLNIKDFTEQVAKPRAQNLASKVQTVAIRAARNGASQAIVVNKRSGGVIVNQEVDVNQLRFASATIRKAKSFGDLAGIVDPMLMSSSTNLMNLFLPADVSTKMWRESSLGRYANAEWLETPDCETHTAGTLLDASSDSTNGRSYKVTATVAEGATSLGITVTGAGTGVLTAGETVKAGDVFYVQAGLNKIKNVDIHVKTMTQSDRAFICNKDYTVTAADVSAGAFSISVSAIYTTGLANANASSLPVADAAVTKLFSAGSTYVTGLLYDKQAVMTGFGSIQPFAAAENTFAAESPQGIRIQYTKGSMIKDGADLNRWDVATASVLVRPQHAVALYLAV